MKVTSEQLLDLFGLKVGNNIIVYDNSYGLNEILNMELVIHEARLKLKYIDKIYGTGYFELTWLLDFNFEIIKPKPTLTDDEKVILRNISSDYKYIGRNRFDLYVTTNINDYVTKSTLFIGMYNHLFPFITYKDEKPLNIKELLEQ